MPLFVDADGVPDFGWMDAATRAIARRAAAGTLVSYETTLPVGTTRDRWAPMLEEGSGLTAGRDFHLVFSPGAGADRPGLRRPAPLPEAGRRHRRGVGARAGVEFYEAVLDFDERPDLTAAERRVGPRLRRGGRAGQARRDDLPRREHRAGEPVRPVRRHASASTSTQVIEACNTQPYSHIHQPGIAVGGHCIPVYPRLYLWNDPAATVVRAAREANAAMPEYAVDLLAAALRRPDRAWACWCWAPRTAAA